MCPDHAAVTSCWMCVLSPSHPRQPYRSISGRIVVSAGAWAVTSWGKRGPRRVECFAGQPRAGSRATQLLLDLLLFTIVCHLFFNHLSLYHIEDLKYFKEDEWEFRLHSFQAGFQPWIWLIRCHVMRYCFSEKGPSDSLLLPDTGEVRFRYA